MHTEKLKIDESIHSTEDSYITSVEENAVLSIVVSGTFFEQHKEVAARIVKTWNLHDELVETLQEAQLQIEYLHKKFKETGSGNNVLSKIDTLLQQAKP